MVSAEDIRRALSAIVNKNTNETARIISRSLAFQCVLNKDTPGLVEHVLAMSNMEENIHDKIRLFLFALDTSKQSPELFMETSCTIAKLINEMPEFKAEVAYNIISSAGQKEFSAIIKAAGLASGKKKTRAVKKVETSGLDPKIVHAWVDPKSSKIYRYMYSPESRILHIKFNSNPEKVYSYYDVGPVLFRDFTQAKSRGTFFGKWIAVQHSANKRQ